MFKRTSKDKTIGLKEAKEICNQFFELPKCDCFDTNYCKRKINNLFDKLDKYSLLCQGYGPLIHGFYIFQQLCSRESFNHKPEHCNIAFVYGLCASILIAEKFNSDIPYTNKYWAKSLGVKLDYLNQIEIAIIKSSIKIHIDIKDLFETKIETTD